MKCVFPPWPFVEGATQLRLMGDYGGEVAPVGAVVPDMRVTLHPKP